MNTTMEVAGYYKLEAVAEDGTRRVLADWFPNIIVNGGLDRIMGNSGVSLYSRAMVGTGSSTPTATDTGLVSFLTSNSTQQGAATTGNAASSPWFGFIRTTYRFGTGVAAGNLTEVGVGWGASGVNSSLFSRALILDGGGSPTTITVLSGESLDVTYEFRLYAPLVDTSYNIVISGVTYAVTGRAAAANTWANNSLTSDLGSSVTFQSYSGAIGSITSIPASPSGVASSGSWGAYTPGTFSRTYSIAAPIAQWNAVGGIGSLYQPITGSGNCTGAWQWQFTPPIPKDATKSLTINGVYTIARRP